MIMISIFDSHSIFGGVQWKFRLCNLPLLGVGSLMLSQNYASKIITKRNLLLK